jgi:hypothetical protein
MLGLTLLSYAVSSAGSAPSKRKIRWLGFTRYTLATLRDATQFFIPLKTLQQRGILLCRAQHAYRTDAAVDLFVR